LKYIGVAFFLANGFIRPLWGFLYDKVGFKKLFVLLTVIEIAISASLYFAREAHWIFYILVVLSGALLAGVFALMPAFVQKTFGIK
jgi:MFS family permease